MTIAELDSILWELAPCRDCRATGFRQTTNSHPIKTRYCPECSGRGYIRSQIARKETAARL